MWGLFKFLCAPPINLHWSASRPKAQGGQADREVWPRLRFLVFWSSRQFYLLQVWQTTLLRGFGRPPGGVLCVRWRERQGLWYNTVRVHRHSTLIFICIFINPEFSYLSRKWMGWMLQNVPSIGSNSCSSFQSIYLSAALRLKAFIKSSKHGWRVGASFFSHP